MAKLIALINAITAIFAVIFGRNKRKEEVQKVQDKQQEINYQSQVEEIVKSAESKDEKTKADALAAVRLLISE